MIYDKNQEPIVISKVTLDILLKYKTASDLIALYTFYYYTAKWQCTPQPRCTTSYTAKGLSWPEERVRRNKKTLLKVGLINDIVGREKQTNKVTGHYIKVNFIYGQSHPYNLPDPGFPGDKCLIPTNNIKCLDTDNEYKNIHNYGVSDETPISISSSNQNNHQPSKFQRTAPKQGTMKRKLQEKLTPSTPVKVKQYKPNPYVEYWNVLPNTRKHKNPNSKIYQEAVRLFYQLERGEFGLKNKIDDNWLTKHNIPDKWLVHPYSEIEIKKTLEHISHLLMPGYWPEDKSSFRSKSLSDFLYNANSGGSWFLKVLMCPPKPLIQTIRNPELAEFVEEYIQWCGELDNSEKKAVDTHMSRLSKLYKALPKEIYGGLFRHLCKTDKKFIRQYIDWLTEQRWVQHRTASLLDPKGKTFQSWAAEFFDEDSNPMQKSLMNVIQENRLLQKRR